MRKVKLTKKITEPWTHAELVEVTEEQGPEGQPLAVHAYQEHNAGDVIKVSDDTAAHLVATDQAEPV
jgi:hypothetical protein